MSKGGAVAVTLLLCLAVPLVYVNKIAPSRYDWVARSPEIRPVGVGQSIAYGPFGMSDAWSDGHGKPAMARVRVEATKPVHIYFTDTPDTPGGWCMQENVLASEVTCSEPKGRYLVVLDASGTDFASSAATGLRAVFGDREALASNKVSTVIYDWKCVEHCR